MKEPQTPLTIARSMVTARATQSRTQLAPRGAKCIVLVIGTNYPRQTFRFRDLTTGQVIMRQAIIWHPTADAGKAVSSDTATSEGGRDTGIIRRDPRKPPTTRPHWEAERPSRRSQNRNSMSRRGRVSRKVRLSWREWSMRRGSFWAGGGSFGGGRT